MLDDKSVFTGIVTNAARFQSNTPNQSTTPKEDNPAIPLKTGHIYSDSEAWAKELMVTLRILYEEVLTCSLKPETLMMVERKLKSTTWDVWVQNFSSKAEIWKRFKEREEAYRDKFQREASQAFKPQNNEEGNT